jgi:hypothetical protein
LAWKDGSGMFLSSLGLYPGNTSCLWSFGTRLVGWGREGRGWIALLLDHVPLIHCCPLVGPKVRARVLHPNGKTWKTWTWLKTRISTWASAAKKV